MEGSDERRRYSVKLLLLMQDKHAKRDVAKPGLPLTQPLGPMGSVSSTMRSLTYRNLLGVLKR